MFKEAINCYKMLNDEKYYEYIIKIIAQSKDKQLFN